MDKRIWKFCLLFLGILAVDSAVAESNAEGADENYPVLHHLSKRQQPIGEFKSVVCNRTVWKDTFEPYLKAEGSLQRDPKNENLKAQFDTVLDNLNRWKNTNLHRLHDACGLQKFLECGEDLRCICGTGNVPYSYEAADSGTCLAKRGSICLVDKDCAAGLICQERKP